MTTQSMRIALLGPASSIHLRRWAHALVSREHTVCVISQHRVDRVLLPVRADVFWLPHSGSLGYFTNAPSLRRHLLRWEPDLLNVHYASGYGTLAAAVGFKPTLLSVWGSDVYDFPYESPIKGWLLRRTLRRATALASTSGAMADQVRRLVPECDRVAVTPFGVDTSYFSPQPSQRDTKCLTVGIVKSLAFKYGVDILIRAFAGLLFDDEMRDIRAACRLFIVGDGPDRQSLQQLASHLGIADCTLFVGAVEHDQVPSYLNRFDIYAAPSRSESFGVAVIEAGACGLPVVVSDAGGLPEVVIDGVTGLVVQRNDVYSLQRALKRLLLDASLRDRLGRQGRKHVVCEYEWNRCVQGMERLYAETVTAHRPQRGG